MKRLACIAVIAVAALGSSRASAQGSFLVGPHMGLQDQSGASETNQLFGATARLKFLPALAAEGMISYREDDMAGELGTVRMWPVMVTGLLYPLPFLYGGVGGGWHNTTYDLSDQLNDLGFDDDTRQDFGWHVAVGAEVPASSWLKLMADVRWVYLGEQAPDIPDVISGEVLEDYRVITLGMLFAL